MIFAYADPPYIGQSKRHYGREEVDHEALLAHLVTNYPDGWALSCSSPSQPMLTSILERMGLHALDGDYRTMAWVKPFAIFKPGVNPAYAWEPVIVRGGRKRGRLVNTVRDYVSANITLKRGLTGAKPDDFCRWLFDVLGMEPIQGDELHDLFPGSGAVTKSLREWFNEACYQAREQPPGVTWDEINGQLRSDGDAQTK